MYYLTQWVLAIAAGLLLAVTGPARAEDNSLALVPAKAPIVVQVNGFEKARDRLGKLLGNALPDIAPKLAKQIDDGIKELAEGRDLKAISKDGRVFLVVTDLANLSDNPQIAVLVPISGYADFKDSFLKADERKSLKKDEEIESVKLEGKDEPFYMVDRKEYVVVTHDKDVAKSFTKADPTSLDKELSKETLKAFLDQDVAVYVNLKMINKEYGAQIRGFKALIDLGLQGGGMGIDKKQIEAIKTVFNSFLSLLDDGVAAVIGFEFRPEGANFHFVAQFGATTDTNDFLKKLTPANLKQLNSLPAGQVLYSASNFDPSKSKTLAALLRDAMADDEDEDAKKGVLAALKELSENGRIVEVSAHKTLTGGLEVAEYKDGASAVASTLKLFKSLSKSGSFAGAPLKGKPEIKEGAESIGDFKLNHVKLAFDFDKAVEKLPEQVREASRAVMQKTVGEKTNVWFGAQGNKIISVTGTDWAEAKAIIEEYLKGGNPLDKDDSYQITRKQLPADATMLFFGDSARFIEIALEMVKGVTAGIPGIPGGGIPDLKAPKGKPAYFGAAIILKAEYVSFDLFVPVTAVQQVRKMFAPLIDGDN